MPLTLHALAIDTFAPQLHTLSVLLAQGAPGLDDAALVAARLAPDMYPLSKQVQLACHTALDAVARLRGQAPPAHDLPETETREQLAARIAATIAALREIPADALAGADDRPIRRPLMDGLVLEMTGAQYLRDWSFPNFYFHIVTAYAILRHHGAPLGKRDFMQHIAPAIRRGE